MKLHTFIFVRITPIFLALAAANAGALYWAQSREIEANLAEEAEAASVTLSEYFAARPQVAERFGTTSGRAAMTVAMAQMPGLKSVALIDSSGRCCLARAGGPPEGEIAPVEVVMQPRVSGLLTRTSGEKFIRSVVRLPSGQILAVEIDADRSVADRQSLLWQIGLILVGGGLVGLLVSSLIALWLRADVRSLYQLITSGGSTARRTNFVETQDVADAVIMLRANLAAGGEFKKRSLADRRITA